MSNLFRPLAGGPIEIDIDGSDMSFECDDEDPLPPLDEPHRIAEHGMEHWEKKADRDRMLVTKIARLSTTKRDDIFKYFDALSDLSDLEIWDDMKAVMQAGRDKTDSVPGFDGRQYRAIERLDRLFLLYCYGQDMPKQELFTSSQVEMLLSRETDLAAFLQVCRTVLNSLQPASRSSDEDTTPSECTPIEELIPQVVEYVKEYMAQYDGSHDFNHIKRVLGLAHTLRLQEPSAYNKYIVTLAALLHDVGDRKYLKPGQDGKLMVFEVLCHMRADNELARRIQQIVNHVSYSAEVAPGGREAYDLCVEHCGRELEVVQDADRLDAIGAVGVGRCFAFGGSKGRGLQDSIEHFEDKLEKLQGMMKTKLGRKMAEERTKTIRELRRAWERENEEAMRGLKVLSVDLD